ncbi:MAG: imidazoleglycerol-phosphate dehydratase HisB [Deltaproteobacteria bacterium]|nr:imidazoleglycerol-phosphate dehydratase HisB [Deltaproteobacteria bacterium]
MTGTKRVVFIKAADVVAGAGRDEAPIVQAMVIPALHQLQRAGFTLLIDGVGAEFGSARNLLKAQGLSFFELAAMDLAHGRPNVFMYRELLGGASLDTGRSAVIGDTQVDQLFAANLGVNRYEIGGQEIPDWGALAEQLVTRPRMAKTQRRTGETDITIAVNLDGDVNRSLVSTGHGFFDHMLAQLARHSGIEMQIAVTGDLHVDEHHTVEDTALALGDALRAALGDRFGIERYAFVMPMDETRVNAALDLSGRPTLVWAADFGRSEVGGLPTEMVPHFFRSLAERLGATLHVEVRGENTHHMVEGAFKAVAKCLGRAVSLSANASVPSTKGVL